MNKFSFKLSLCFLILMVISNCQLFDSIENSAPTKHENNQFFYAQELSQYSFILDTIKISGRFLDSGPSKIFLSGSEIPVLFQDSNNISFILPPHSISDSLFINFKDTILNAGYLNVNYWGSSKNDDPYFLNEGGAEIIGGPTMENCKVNGETIYCESRFNKSYGIYKNNPNEFTKWELFENTDQFSGNQSFHFEIVNNQFFIYDTGFYHILQPNGWQILNIFDGQKTLTPRGEGKIISLEGKTFFIENIFHEKWIFWEYDDSSINWRYNKEIPIDTLLKPNGQLFECNDNVYYLHTIFSNSSKVIGIQIDEIYSEQLNIGTINVQSTIAPYYETSCIDEVFFISTYPNLYSVSNGELKVEIESESFFGNVAIDSTTYFKPIRGVVKYKDVLIGVGQFIAFKKNDLWEIYYPSLKPVLGNFNTLVWKMLGYRHPFWVDPKGYLWSDKYENFSRIETMRLERIGL